MRLHGVINLRLPRHKMLKIKWKTFSRIFLCHLSGWWGVQGLTYLTLGASKTDHLGLQHHLISEAKKEEISLYWSFYCCTGSYSVQTEKLTSSLEKVRCQLTSETETIDSSDEVHVVNNVTVPFEYSCPGILQMAWPSSLPFEVKLADICGWRGWMAGWVIEVRWEPVFQPLGPMSWLPPPPPPPNPSFHPFLQILHQSSEDLAATASQLKILATNQFNLLASQLLIY